VATETSTDDVPSSDIGRVKTSWVPDGLESDSHSPAWLRGTAELDGRGFVRTGEKPNDGEATLFSPYQTDLPGVFAVGDVRSGSV